MSFIYDDEKLMIDLLLNAVGFDKKAQVAADASKNVEYQNYLNLSSKLVDQLKETFSPSPADPNAVGAKGGSAGATVADLSNIGNFLEFLVRNAITVSGQRVVFAANEEPPTRNWLPINAERIVPFMETTNNQGGREALKAEYYVNKDLISKYMNTLAGQIGKEDAETQKFMKVFLSGLMERINKIFGTKMTTDYKEPENVFPDNTVLDNVPNPIVSTGENESNPLTIANLKSPETLNAWIRTHNMTVKDAKGQLLNIKENYDKCAFINALYSRAVAMANAAGPEDKKKCAQYVKMMTQLASQASCTLGGGQPSGQSAQPTALTPQLQGRIFSTLPFVTGAIDFARIETFLGLVEPLVPSAGPAVAEVKELIQQFGPTYLSQSGTKIISLRINSNQYANMMKDKQFPGRQMIPSLRALNEIIDGTRNVLDQFAQLYKTRITDTNYIRLIGDQIGENQTDDSIYRSNAQGLANLMGSPTTRPA